MIHFYFILEMSVTNIVTCSDEIKKQIKVKTRWTVN